MSRSELASGFFLLNKGLVSQRKRAKGAAHDEVTKASLSFSRSLSLSRCACPSFLFSSVLRSDQNPVATFTDSTSHFSVLSFFVCLFVCFFLCLFVCQQIECPLCSFNSGLAAWADGVTEFMHAETSRGTDRCASDLSKLPSAELNRQDCKQGISPFGCSICVQDGVPVRVAGSLLVCFRSRRKRQGQGVCGHFQKQKKGTSA